MQNSITISLVRTSEFIFVSLVKLPFGPSPVSCVWGKVLALHDELPK